VYCRRAGHAHSCWPDIELQGEVHAAPTVIEEPNTLIFTGLRVSLSNGAEARAKAAFKRSALVPVAEELMDLEYEWIG